MSAVVIANTSIGAGTVPFTPSTDAEIVAMSSTGKFVLSGNPSLTVSAFEAGANDQTVFGYGAAAGFQYFGIVFPVFSGEKYYVAFSAAGSVIVYLKSPS